MQTPTDSLVPECAEKSNSASYTHTARAALNRRLEKHLLAVLWETFRYEEDAINFSDWNLVQNDVSKFSEGFRQFLPSLINVFYKSQLVETRRGFIKFRLHFLLLEV